MIMLQNKDINKISELKNGFTHRWLEPDFILSSLKCFSFSSLSKSLMSIKNRGYSFEAIFSILICLPFMGHKTIHSAIRGPFVSYIEAKKDVFYRLKNNGEIDWRAILWLFVGKFVKATALAPEVTDSPKCLVIDDSLLEKTGKCIERVSRMWDHVTGRYLLGFKLLVLAYWDGTSCIPVDFSLHRERGRNKERPFGLKAKELKKQFKKDRPKGSSGQLRGREVDDNKIESAQKMVKRAFSKKLKVDYLLMDSWFTCWSFVELVKKAKKQTVHLIGMYKTPKTKFCWQGKQFTHKQIQNELGKPIRCRKLGLYYKETIVEWNQEQIKIFFSRQGKNGKWRVFVTTNTSLTFIRMIEIYQIRWTIEVLFKEGKQLLNLGKCQSNDFDAQIAETTITMIQHIMLTLKYRYETYESKGELFAQVQDEVNEYRLSERLWGLFLEMVKLIEMVFEGVDGDEIIEKIIYDDRASEIFGKLFNLNEGGKNAA
jgi:hypothetical protein